MTRGLYKCRIIKRDRDILYSIIRTALESIDITIKKTQSTEIKHVVSAKNMVYDYTYNWDINHEPEEITIELKIV